MFQAATANAPGHQIGQLRLRSKLYRPVVTRVAVNNRSVGRGGGVPKPHQHEVYHLFAPRAGRLHILVEEEVLQAPVGAILAVSPREAHALMTEREACVWSAITFQYLNARSDAPLALPFRLLLEAVAGHTLHPHGDRFIEIPDASLSRFHEAAGEIAEHAPTDALFAANRLQHLLIQCINWAEPHAPSGPDARLDAVRAWVHRHFREPLVIDQLAREASMSRRALTRRFKARYGKTLKGLQIELRMAAARLMLRTTDLQIQQIAAETGYSDLYQFTAAFKKHCGMPPTSFRQSRPTSGEQ